MCKRIVILLLVELQLAVDDTIYCWARSSNCYIMAS